MSPGAVVQINLSPFPVDQPNAEALTSGNLEFRKMSYCPMMVAVT